MKKTISKKLIFFTTIYKSEMGGIKDVLLGLGKKEVIDIDKEYQIRKLFGPWGLDLLAELYQGFSEKKLKDVSYNYQAEYLLPGTKELVFGLKDRGFSVGVVCSNPQFMMDVLKKDLFLDFAIGTKLEFKKGEATGKIEKEVNRYVEVEILKQKIKEYNINKENVITIGRSSVNHLPIAKASGLYIGFDPTKDTIKQITKMIKANADLKKIFF